MKDSFAHRDPGNASKNRTGRTSQSGKNQLRVALVLLCLVMVCTAVQADHSGDVTRSEKTTPLLGDHLRIRLPEGFRVEARSVNIMAAEAPQEDETRLVFDQGDKRLVLMVYELYQTGGPEFAGELARAERQSVNATPEKYDLILERESFSVYQSDAEPTEVASEAVRVTTAWVVNTDHTVQTLVGYANPEAAREIQEVQELFTRALKTLEPGQRQLVTKARLQRLDVYSQTNELVVQLEDDWAYTLQTGPDFLVHKIRKVVPFGTDGPEIGLYVGGHPSNFHDNDGLAPERFTDLLIGEKTDWLRSSQKGNIMMESIRPATELGGGLMFHLFINATSAADLQGAQRIASTMHIVEKRTPVSSSKR